MNDKINLELFLEHLRLRGVYVGASELDRLRVIFFRVPQVSRAELLNILQSVLAKNDLQRNIVKNIFDQLVLYEEDSVMEEYDRKNTDGISVGITSSPNGDSLMDNKKRYTSKIFYVVLLLLFFTFIGWGVLNKEIFYGSYNSTLIVVTHLGSKSSISLTLLIFGLLCLGVLFVKIYIRVKIEPLPSVVINSIGKSFFPSLKNGRQIYLLNAKSRRDIERGVKYYIDDNINAFLNIDNSVYYTAMNGVPIICFDGTIRPKKIWLWQDQIDLSSNLIHLIDEIAMIFKKMNIDVYRGYFHGLPSCVRNARGEAIWSSLAQEQFLDSSDLVLVFFNHKHLLDVSKTIDMVFKGLSQVENLAIINDGVYAQYAGHVFEKYALKCLLPDQIGEWLNGKKEFSFISNYNVADDLHRLAIACSLPSRQIMEDEIKILHEILQLNCIWFCDRLSQYAEKTGFGWSFERSRYDLLSEFSVMACSITQDYHKVLDFWIEREADINVQLIRQETLNRPWSNSRRQKQLEMDIAFLELWRSPDSAAEKIHSMTYINKFKGEIQKKMKMYSCRHSSLVSSGITKMVGEEGIGVMLESDIYPKIKLPFFWGDLPAKTQRQLLESGFDGVEKSNFFLLDKITQVTFGLLLGIVIMSLFEVLFVS